MTTLIDDLTEEQVRLRLMALDAEFKTGSERHTREIAAERMQMLAAGLRHGTPVITLERLSGVSRGTIRRIVPTTGEVRWLR